jgi:Ran GTPase-activating protein (RanGAP) involved in mRNA processing and transport
MAYKQGIKQTTMACLSHIMLVKYISVLDIRKNQLGNAGAKILATIIKLSKSLVHLDARSNCIGDTGKEIK